MPLRPNIKILYFNLQKDIFILVVIFLQLYHGVVLDDRERLVFIGTRLVTTAPVGVLT